MVYKLKWLPANFICMITEKPIPTSGSKLRSYITFSNNGYVSSVPGLAVINTNHVVFDIPTSICDISS